MIAFRKLVILLGFFCLATSNLMAQSRDPVLVSALGLYDRVQTIAWRMACEWPWCRCQGPPR